MHQLATIESRESSAVVSICRSWRRSFITSYHDNNFGSLISQGNEAITLDMKLKSSKQMPSDITEHTARTTNSRNCTRSV